MDFFKINTRLIENGPNRGAVEIYADLVVKRSKDLMIRGKAFYAVWDTERGMWSTDEYDVQRLVDRELYLERDRLERLNPSTTHIVKTFESFNTKEWIQFKKYLFNVNDNYEQLDRELTFADTVVEKSDYVSKRLPYSLSDAPCSSWDTLVGTLYSVDNRAKIEWAIGAVVAGDAKNIHKFLVFYGPPGSGKSTIINVIAALFDGYETYIDAAALANAKNGNSFATDVFRSNPLVGMQHDGDLSEIEDNTGLNSITAHELMKMNEKFKPSYTDRVNAFLFLGTNKPVKITDAKSGIGRRLIDVHPTGVKIPIRTYRTLMKQIYFDLGSIANHCLNVYKEMGASYYDEYTPVEMMLQTDVFYNFVEANFDIFKKQNQATLKQAYSLYKEFCSETGIKYVLPQYRFRDELRNYFNDFSPRGVVDGIEVRSVYTGFNYNKYRIQADIPMVELEMNQTESIFDTEYGSCTAQYAIEDSYGNEIPFKKWMYVHSTLDELDTTKTHFVKIPENHIVIDFDLKDSNGNKSKTRNLEAASMWPPTYAEFSKSGSGLHLHYIYQGDVSLLDRNYSNGIEVKVFTGNASLRRRVTKCNNLPIAIFTGSLPQRERKPVEEEYIKSERTLRKLIDRNLRKEIHPGTKSSVDFIKKILDDAYISGLRYDVSDMRGVITTFAANSTNQASAALKATSQMRFKSDESLIDDSDSRKSPDDLVFFDVEVFPNLFIVCWKYEDKPTVVKMINPTPTEVEALFNSNLVGFNNRKYDNHILYARHLGYDNDALYRLSQRIISGDRNAFFGEAYNLSYADIFDISSKKQSLKKFEIELGLTHIENEHPWDEPVPEELWAQKADYCANDVIATEAVKKDRQADWMAREILADLSGLSMNARTEQHTARIIFEGSRRPQSDFVYTDLSEMFPGYKYKSGVSTYKGMETGEGGLVYAQPGYYEEVVVLDVASMHPTSIEELNLFGKYTKNFADLKSARLAIKHKDYGQLDDILNGALKKYIDSKEQMDALSYALKIVVNSVYGLTNASFETPFRDIRNKDNIVAKRGALFMVDLKEFVENKGYIVAHIKTDSIKIPQATPEIIEDVISFGKQYGYTFEMEDFYEKFCLVNDAVYIAKAGRRWDLYDGKVVDGRSAWLVGSTTWSAVGSQFQHPYVFKTLFSGEEVTYEDFQETKEVTAGRLYLDFGDESERRFIGRTGRFVPVREGCGGGTLYRVKDDKSYAATGTKGYLWKEAFMSNMDEVDTSYAEKLSKKAVATIEQFVNFEEFVS